ncbi:ATP-binding protein [Aurantivibrio plasticivorans]
MIKLKAKFFLISIAINVTLAAGIYLLLSYTFEQVFTQYTNQRELNMAQRFAEQLTKQYRVDNNWQRIASSPTLFKELLLQSSRRSPPPDAVHQPPPPPDRLIPFDLRASPPPPRRAPPHFFTLLDTNKQPIAGNEITDADSLLVPILSDNTTIGFLSVPQNNRSRDYLDSEFATVFQKNFLVILALSLAVGFLAAYFLAHVLVKRIVNLTTHVKSISQGDYLTHLSLTGRDELNELAKDLNNLSDVLHNNQLERKKWSADISHELRTPVAILLADIEALRDGIRPLSQDAISRLLNHATRLKKLINDLHELSLTDLGSMSYRKSTFDLKQLLQETVKYAEMQFRDAGLEVHTEYPKNQTPIYGDANRIQQLVDNLLNNACFYTDRPGRVNISLQSDNKIAILEVSDSSPGVDESLYPDLTRRLFRVEDSRNRKTGGSGLGLSLAANIVDAHNGKMHFSSSELGGLKVRIELPLEY